MGSGKGSRFGVQKGGPRFVNTRPDFAWEPRIPERGRKNSILKIPQTKILDFLKEFDSQETPIFRILHNVWVKSKNAHPPPGKPRAFDTN